MKKAFRTAIVENEEGRWMVKYDADNQPYSWTRYAPETGPYQHILQITALRAKAQGVTHQEALADFLERPDLNEEIEKRLTNPDTDKAPTPEEASDLKRRIGDLLEQSVPPERLAAVRQARQRLANPQR